MSCDYVWSQPTGKSNLAVCQSLIGRAQTESKTGGTSAAAMLKEREK
jgi:hypothetical protein